MPSRYVSLTTERQRMKAIYDALAAYQITRDEYWALVAWDERGLECLARA